MMATRGPIRPESIGFPTQPPFLTTLGMVAPGKLATDPSILPKGAPVTEVLYEELRGTAGPAGVAEASVRTKFDEQGRVTEQIERRWNRETDTRYSYRSGRLASMETTFPDAKSPVPMSWNYWTYDDRGKLTEYRRGSGVAIQNHKLGFQYDAKGRLLAFDYREGEDDKPFSHTEIGYSKDGQTVTVTTTFAGTKIIDESIRTLDDRGRIVRVKLEAVGRATTVQASDVSFRYDDHGRLLEQTTNATKFSDSGAEHDLPPGTISIAYDDRAHSKTTRYSNPVEGSL
jgi:YD repeat-containing protein